MNYKEKYLNFLGSQLFPEIIEGINLDPLIYNKLIVAHVATIGAQSTGIKEGSCRVKYVYSTDEGFTPNVLGPMLAFSFYTTKYALIESSLRSTNSSIRIKNINFSDFNNSRTFKNFILKKEMKHLPGHTWESVADEEIKISFEKLTKKSKEEQNNSLYKQIIATHKDIEVFLNNYFLQQELTDSPLISARKLKL